MGKNWNWSFKRGRERRLELEEQAYHAGVSIMNTIPLHSHDATLQSYFNRGWHSVTQAEIRMHLGICHLPSAQSPIDKIKELKACLFQQSQH